jgi:repressor LexA
MNELTARQQAVLSFLKDYAKTAQSFPSLSVIAQHFGISRHSAKFHVDALRRKGFVQKQENQNYFALTEHLEQDPNQFELVCEISAGIPDFSEPAVDPQNISFNSQFFGGGNQKALTVSGQSMSGDMIDDGDIAIIRLQKIIGRHDIAAVRVYGEGITLKRLSRSRQAITLIPSNPQFKPQTYPSDQVEVLGKLVGVVRKQ